MENSRGKEEETYWLHNPWRFFDHSIGVLLNCFGLDRSSSPSTNPQKESTQTEQDSMVETSVESLQVREKKPSKQVTQGKPGKVNKT